MTLFLVWDTSGSMAEMGKHLTARGVARAIEQYLRLGHGSAELKLIAWGNEARVIDWCPDQEFPAEMSASKGSANAEALITVLGEQPTGQVLLITDGFWSQADAKALRRWQQSLPLNAFRVIKIGADANPRMEGANVFVAEDLFAALDGWLEGGGA